jgi:hypothetical protein
LRAATPRSSSTVNKAATHFIVERLIKLPINLDGYQGMYTVPNYDRVPNSGLYRNLSFQLVTVGDKDVGDNGGRSSDEM